MSGVDKSVPVHWNTALELESVIHARPCGYWLAAEADEAVPLLQALGVMVQRLGRPSVLQAETWRETARRIRAARRARRHR